MTEHESGPPWLDEFEPHSTEHGAVQIDGLLRLLGTSSRRVLDLGCGAGRAAVPLASAGHDVVAVDASAAALERCREHACEQGVTTAPPATTATLTLVEADFCSPWSFSDAPFDAIVCLGNTFMTLFNVDDAVVFLGRAAAALATGGRLFIDDIPRDFWPELTGGSWQGGLSPDDDAQLVWDRGDAVFSLRTGDAIDVQNWAPGPADRRFRLWTDGALRLAAGSAGLSAPARHGDTHLLAFSHA